MRRSPGMKRFGRRLGAVTVGLTIFGMVFATTAAHATKPTQQVPYPDVPQKQNVQVSINDDLLRVAANSGASLPLTLITGDKVHVGISADGKPVVRDIEPAARPGGTTVAFHTITRMGSVHVVPNDALALVGNGLLDWGLFDLTKLAAHVATGTVGEVPAIVTYTKEGAAQTAPTVAGATTEKTLSSINSRSMTIEGDGLWWQQVRGKSATSSASARTAGALAGVKKVWLNELAHINLDASVPQIGAPVAWDRGYTGSGVTVAILDTGVDANHPDVAGQIVGQVDFTGSTNGAKDGHGHGTHVASTIAGTGAASNGLRKGVAPGAKLLIGKVCGDGGTCATDAIIAGMEWAAHSDAKIISMSLGGGATDGTDPMSQAVNNLSLTTGRLFVIAAGNAGPDSGTVGTPGAADEALTVAAVDKQDEMASFSSRGPRVGDGAAKPDIAAPGVDIVAARAAGTSMGSVVDEYYTSASGTSMATPHVSGAAAIIAQKYPNLTGNEIKAFLMSTATDLGHDLYAQGAGRVDLARAIDPSIIATGNVNFGRFAYPHSPVAKTLTYTNYTDQPITLTLDPAITSGGQPAPAGLFTLGANELTVPAHGATDVTVTVDGSVLDNGGPYGAYSGLLTARDTDGALRAATRISAFLEPQRIKLTVNVVRPTDATEFTYGNAVIIPVDDKVHLHDGPVAMNGADTMTAALFGGTYSAAVSVGWRDAAGEWHAAVPTVAEVELDKPTTVTLDLRTVKPIKVETPTSTETYQAVNSFERVSATGAWGMTAQLTARYGADEPNWWALPTGSVSTGTLASNTYSVQVTPAVTMQVIGGGETFDLAARYHTPDVSIAVGQQQWQENETTVGRDIHVQVPRLATSGKLSVVYAGTGSAGELANVDARGNLVLLTPTDLCRVTCDFPSLRERVAAVAAAGAVGALVSTPGLASLGTVPSQSATCPEGPSSCPAIQPYAALPIVSVAYDSADKLIRRIGDETASDVEIQLGGSARPTVYAVAFGSDGQIPSDLPYQVKENDLDQVDHYFHADRPGEITNLAWQQQAESGPIATSLDLPRTTTQQTLTTFVKRQDNAITQFAVSWADYARASILVQERSEIQETVLGAKNTLHWNTGPTVPGAVPQVRTASGFTVQTGGLCSACRKGDTFYPNFYLTSSGGGRQAMIGIVNNTGIAEFYFGIANCEPSACDVSLSDESGNELERRLAHLSFGIGSEQPGSLATLMSGGQR